MKKFSLILSSLGVMILLFDRLARLQHWVSDYSKTVTELIESQGVDVGVDPLNGLPVLGFIILALAAFLYNTSDKNAFYPATGVNFLIMVIGYMFKILHWPGAGIILVLSYGFLILVIVPWLTMIVLKNPKPEGQTATDTFVKEENPENQVP